jgi:hypothetical protein
MIWAFAILMVAFLVTMLIDAEIQFTLGKTTISVSPAFFVGLAFVAVCLVAIVAMTVRVWRDFRS